MPSLDQAIQELLSTYHQLNANHIEELPNLPSPLEFLKFVHKGRPFVIRGAAADWPAVQWTAEFLESVMADRMVQVAITPLGNADAVVRDTTTEAAYFVKPLEVQEPFTDFIRYVRDQEQSNNGDEVVKYSQAQNDNLRGEYFELYKYVARDIPWARIALGQDPDAINLWIGNSRSVTALHKDNYENIYCQLVGSKHFVLVPPVELACVNEKLLPSATYALDDTSSWKLNMEEETIPIPTWDPDKPNENGNRFSRLSMPLRVDINPSDLLYLPALWYHKVSQSCSEQGICCAVNYWYDMDYEGTVYASNAFIHEISTIANNEKPQNG